MPYNPSRYAIADFPHASVEVACERCARHGWLRRERLVAKHGGGTALPDLLPKIAKVAGCGRVGKWHTPCGVYYVALKPE